MKKIVKTGQFWAIKLLEQISPLLVSKVVFSILCRAKPSTMTAEEVALMATAERIELFLNGNKVLCYRWGQGKKTVLLMHGWGSRAARFRLLIQKLLGQGYQVLSYDFPGHGESEGPTVSIEDNLLLNIQLQQQFGSFHAIVSHSFGSMHAFYAIKNGLVTERLIALSSVSEFSYLGMRFSSFYQLKPATIERLHQRFERYFKTDSIWQRFSAHCDPQLVEAKVLLIHDRHDNFVEPEQSAMIHRALGHQSKLYITDNLGHFRILQDAAVLKRILDEINLDDKKQQLFSSLIMPEMR